ncbi:MAG: DUF1413 domain-containing protein [Lachnospiraceae bacterium]|nr:DUF1413 domain-containing protein [Lachnospiraceae bacterium]
MSKKFQIVVSDEEYEFLQKVASDKGISVSQYIRDKVFDQNNYFEVKWNSLLERISNYPVGLEFDISMIVGREEWSSYDKSTKLSLARTLNRQVVGGKLPFVKIAGKSAANVTIYIKR